MRKALAVVLVVGCGGRAEVVPTTPPPTPAPPTSAAEIVAAMTARYAKATSYRDHGLVTSGVGGVVTTTRTFETTFVRDQRFRFALRDEDDPQRGFEIWADRTHAYSRWWAPPRMTDDGAKLGVAIAAAAKPSLGVVQTLAHLLRPDAVPSAALTELRLEGTESIDDEPCWIIAGVRDGTPTKLWIDQASFALRRSTEQHDAVVDTATFRPTLDPTLDVAEITPPDFSEDYAADSPVRAGIRPLLNTRAPDFDAALVTGTIRADGRARLADLAGHVVVVDFWATWCGPCRTTLPRLNEWHKQHAARGLRIVGLSSEPAAELDEFAKDNQLEYMIAHDDDAKAARAYQVSALPMIVVVDRTGVIRFVTLGAGDLDAVEAVFESLLGSPQR